MQEVQYFSPEQKIALGHHLVIFWIIFLHQTLWTIRVYNILLCYHHINHRWRQRADFYKISIFRFSPRNWLSGATGGWWTHDIRVYHRLWQFTAFGAKNLSKKLPGGVQERFFGRPWKFENPPFTLSSAKHRAPSDHFELWSFSLDPILRVKSLEKVIWYTHAKFFAVKIWIFQFYKICIIDAA